MTKKIYYTGIGCRRDNLHSKTEFLHIMWGLFEDRIYLRRNGDPKGVPVGKIKMRDLPNWMQFANAIWINKNTNNIIFSETNLE